MTALPSKTGTRSVTGAALLAALAATWLTGAVAPAQAQGYGVVIEDDVILPPRAVIVRLGRAGFTGMSHPRFDGETYQVEADSPWGNRVQLVVDARTGRILDRERLEAPLIPPGTIPGGRRPGYGWTETEARPSWPRDSWPRDSWPRESWPRDEALRERAPRDNGWRDGGARDGGAYAPVPLSRGEPLPPVGERPEERRVAARPLPPAGSPTGASPIEAPARATPAPRAAGPNPLGLNPDSPAARSGTAARREPAPEGAKPEAPRRTAARTKPAETETPAALVPPLAPKSESTKSGSTKAEPARKDGPPVKAAEAAPKAPDAKDGGWKTPPDGNRPVRVIGGITQVPGKDEPAKD